MIKIHFPSIAFFPLRANELLQQIFANKSKLLARPSRLHPRFGIHASRIVEKILLQEFALFLCFAYPCAGAIVQLCIYVFYQGMNENFCSMVISTATEEQFRFAIYGIDFMGWVGLGGTLTSCYIRALS